MKTSGVEPNRLAAPVWIGIGALRGNSMRIVVNAVTVNSTITSVPMAIIAGFTGSNDAAIYAITPPVPIRIVIVVRKSAGGQGYSENDTHYCFLHDYFPLCPLDLMGTLLLIACYQAKTNLPLRGKNGGIRQTVMPH